MPLTPGTRLGPYEIVSPGLERIVLRCLEKRPEERFRTAHDLGIALDAISTSSTRPAAGRSGTLSDRPDPITARAGYG
jgi:hypothetical protein